MKRKIQIINGPNLNRIQFRENEIYGKLCFNEYLEKLYQQYPEVEIHSFQSNIEGEIIDKLHSVDKKYDGIILNAGGYTHSSVSIRDAVLSIQTPVIEVHISNLANREGFRHNSIISAVCKGYIAGFGLNSYALAIQYFLLF
jgi:3-dehydroquinate dehydratase II